MPNRDAYQERVNAHIESVYESLDLHDRHLQSTESTSLDAHEAALRELKRKRKHLDGLLKELEEAGEHGWQHLREGIDTTVAELKHGLELARKKLRGD